MSNNDGISTISLLVRSKRRPQVLKSLEKENKIPSKISKDINDNSNHDSILKNTQRCRTCRMP